jgi:hypothetical protein
MHVGGTWTASGTWGTYRAKTYHHAQTRVRCLLALGDQVIHFGKQTWLQQ